MTVLPDRAARDRIESDLDTNLLVEAGAGSGKTRSLVDRMVALVRTGTADVVELAALTFTRKAAGELRERFQLALEARLAGAVPGSSERDRLARALRELDGLFIGTIHAFCARLLRERPLEAGLDPGFQELTEEVSVRLTARFWAAHLERLTAADSPLVGNLRAAGLNPRGLAGLFKEVSEQPDLEFPAPVMERPLEDEVAPIREALEALMEVGELLLPAQEPEKPDAVHQRIQSLIYERDMGWDDDESFFEALAFVCRRKTYRATQKNWGSDGKTRKAAKQLGEAFNAFVATGSDAQRLLERWQTFRYPLVIELALSGAEAWAEERRRLGLLNFQDLLMYAAALLRRSEDARRDLGERYRRILVDEFQDTDPIQAEILLLLASEPSTQERAWIDAVPRPGALFVVGDPKQSIYRFRRADIAVYGLVKNRFAVFGDVVRLQANFRSRPAIAQAVNEVFGDPKHFGGHETELQAAFAPLLPQKDDGRGASGVFHYETGTGKGRWMEIVEDDAGRLATWIAARCGPKGDRSPDDFLILTRKLRYLEPYARALEAHGLAVSVSGAGIGIEREIEELMVLLEAISDPTDPVKAVAALVGLFFGLDYEQLLEHRIQGGNFGFTTAYGIDTPVGAALRKMNRWWEESRDSPADVFIWRLIAELGLLPHAASGALGQLRAGAVVYLLDAVRRSSLDGATSLPGALAALAAALDSTEAEAPLEPGLPNAVRVMNLHRAKGLEAPVVILAAPVGAYRYPVERHVERLEDGSANGYLVVETREGAHRTVIHAMPPGWPEKRAREEAFTVAEDVRLMYVAATRAEDELVVARNMERPSSSPWRLLDEWLDAHGERLELDYEPPPEPPLLELEAEEIRRTALGADRRRRARGVRGYEFLPVTAAAKRVAEGRDQLALSFDEPPPVSNGERSRGVTWGTAAHGALAAAGRDLDRQALEAVCRSLLIENERPLGADGEPTELGELLELVDAVHTGPLWRRAAKAEAVLIEVPFATRAPDGWGPEGVDAEVARQRFVEGVIDLAFKEEDGWVIVDYKTDVRTDPDFPTREVGYRAQVELYAACWERLSGENVKERVLFYTRGGVQDVW